MKKRILGYKARIDAALEANDPDTDWQALLEEHLVQVGFFQHERLVHLIVTALFALLTVALLPLVLFAPSIAVGALFSLVLLLLVGYIAHYHLLENTVQSFYRQYDRLREKAAESKRTIC